MTNPKFRDLIADDSWASTFQSVGQYRTALLKAFDASVNHRTDAGDDLIANCKPLPEHLSEHYAPLPSNDD